MFNRRVGQFIAAIRKRKGITQADLGAKANLAQNVISTMEKGNLKNGIKPGDLIRISDSLQEPEILVEYCRACPVRTTAFKRVFPELNTNDPAVLLDRLQAEMMDAAAISADLGGSLKTAGYRETPEFSQGIERLRRVKLGIEILEQELGLACPAMVQ